MSCSPAPGAHPVQPLWSRIHFWERWFLACPASRLPQREVGQSLKFTVTKASTRRTYHISSIVTNTLTFYAAKLKIALRQALILHKILGNPKMLGVTAYLLFTCKNATARTANVNLKFKIKHEMKNVLSHKMMPTTP